MKSWWLEMILKSDLCVATGDSTAGIVDIEIAQDCGFPIIPGKRIKGSLHNVAMELCDNHMITENVLTLLFGKSGSYKSGMLHLTDAVLYQIPEAVFDHKKEKQVITIEDFGAVRDETVKKGIMSAEEILEVFTVLRTRTALDAESKSAAAGTLRTMRAAKKGLVMRCRIDMEEEFPEAEDVLNMCVKDLRHLGLGITRGFGEIRCTMTPLAQERNGYGSEGKNNKSEKIVDRWFSITLEAPLLLSGKKGLYDDCADCINGNTIKGALAGMYIQDYRLGDQAHEDPVFRRIFLREGVRFGFAFPKRGEDIYDPCPGFLAREKHATSCINRLDDENTGKGITKISSMICIKGKNLYCYQPLKEIRMHHSRPVDRGIGHALADRVKTNQEEMGQFFQYTSLCKGQVFSGLLHGREDDMERLAGCLKKRGNQIRLGRSRTAEYGTTYFCMEENKKTKVCSTAEGRDWMICLQTPLLLLNQENISIEPEPNLLCSQMKEVFGCEVKLEESGTFLKYTRVGGYNAKWRLPTPQRSALDAGTVIHVMAEKEISAAELEGRGWGEMTGEGYGMVKAILYQEAASMGHYDILEAEETEGSLSAAEKEDSSLCTALKQYKKAREYRQQEYEKAINRVNRLLNIPNSTTISQLIGLYHQSEEKNWKVLSEAAKDIKNPKKKKKVEKFLDACKEQSSEFIEIYLQNAKWKARREHSGRS